MFENEQHRSCFGKYLVSSFGSCFIYYEKHVNPFDGFFHIIRGRVLMYKSSKMTKLAGAAAVSYQMETPWKCGPQMTKDPCRFDNYVRSSMSKNSVEVIITFR